MTGKRGRGKGGRASPQKVNTAKRQIEALRLRNEGLSLRDIAAKLGVSSTQISRDIAAAMKDLNNQPVAPKDEYDPIAERREKALEYRQQGYSFRVIGSRLGISHTQAFKDVAEALAELRKTQILEAADLRQMSLERLNLARMTVLPMMLQQTLPVKERLQAVDRWLRIDEREAKLFGLDEPDKLAFVFDPELVEALALLQVSPQEAFIQFRKMVQAEAQKREAV